MDDKELSRLRNHIENMPLGEFHFPEVYGPEWDKLYIGDKVRLGREFFRAVRTGEFPGVEDTGRKKYGGRVYELRKH
jgi:hypothetical protein